LIHFYKSFRFLISDAGGEKYINSIRTR